MAQDWTFRNALKELPRLAAQIEAFARAEGIPEAEVPRLQLVLDEALTNSINHGFPDGGAHEIRIAASVADGVVEFRIEDTGIPFDPTQDAAAPDLNASIEERRIGGLGVHLMRTMMDEMHYQRVDGRNSLVLRNRVARG